MIFQLQGQPEFLLLCILKVVFNDRSTKEAPGDLLILPLNQRSNGNIACQENQDLLDKGVEVRDGILDGGEGEEGDQVAAVGRHSHDHK